jgi:peptidylprolyl isomerase
MRRLLLYIALVGLIAFALACGDDDEDVSDGDPSETAAGFNTSSPGSQETAPAAETTAALNCQDPTGTAPEVQMKQYDAAPEMTIDPARTYTAKVSTERGDFTIKLRPDLAPQHVNSFVFLARDGYYNGVTFHRVLPGFVAQTGDPTGTGSGGPGYVVPAEFSDPSVAKFERGTVGMARTNAPNSAGSQWFVNYVATPSLDGQYTIFGEVTEGMEVVDCITPRDPNSGGNLPPGDKIIGIEITES